MTGRVKVVVPTTEGPSTVLRVTSEDRSLRSVVCLGRSTTVLPVSPAYDAFVRKPSGVVERAVGHPAFRVDVSAPIDDGQSWQLGLYVAHRLQAVGRLVEDDGPADLVLWATGAVDGDLAVRTVEAIAEKLRRSAALIDGAGDRLLVVVPAGQADALGGLPEQVSTMAVDSVAALLRHLGVERPAAQRRWLLWSGAALGLAAAALAAALVLRPEPAGIAPGVASKPPPEVSATAPAAGPAAGFDPAALTLSVLELRPAEGEPCGGHERPVAVDPGQETPPGVCAVVARVSNDGPAAGFIWLVVLAEGTFREYAGNTRMVEAAVGALAPGDAAEARVTAPGWMRRPVVFRILLVAGPREDEQASRALAAIDTLSTGDLDRLAGQFLELGLEVRSLRHRVQPRP
ncbi:hypothetical protein [Thalassobaculum sp.]|uniref:hypothetical protein n=1 Tax=Thalassobaculum sp. TaxID=2022740 RepID=UPI0032EF7A7F